VFGQSSLQAYDAYVNFLTSVYGPSIMSDTNGIGLLKQVITLSNSIAQASSAKDSNVHYQVSLTEKLIGFICNYLSDSQICAELLQDTIKAGTISIGCYWTQKHNNAMGLINNPDMIMETPACVPIALQLTSLYVGSMSANVAPQDTVTAIDGITQLNELHKLFSVSWFQSSGCWLRILDATLRALVLNTHPLLNDSLVEIVDQLFKSDISNSQDPLLSQGFWSVIGNQTYQLASEFQVEDVNTYFNELSAKFPQLKGLDVPAFINYVILPITADIAKAKS
jgi:hypothetical protein